MPVLDHPVHPSTRIGAEYRAGCWSGSPAADGYWAQDGVEILRDKGMAFSVRRMVWVKNEASKECRQVLPLAECRGCLYPKDLEYLRKWK